MQKNHFRKYNNPNEIDFGYFIICYLHLFHYLQKLTLNIVGNNQTNNNRTSSTEYVGEYVLLQSLLHQLSFLIVT